MNGIPIPGAIIAVSSGVTPRKRRKSRIAARNRSRAIGLEDNSNASSGVRTSVLSLTDHDSTNKAESGVEISLISRKHMLPIRFLLTSISIADPRARKRVVLMNGLFL